MKPNHIPVHVRYPPPIGSDGVVSLECSGTDENTRKSVEWMRGVVKGLKRKAKDR